MIIWSFTVFQYRFDPPKVKANLISSIKNFICELDQELLNALTLNEFREFQN